MYAIGYDLGSSSIKASIIRIENGATVASTKFPDTEMPMIALNQGWAEQDPDVWWENVCRVTHTLLEKHDIEPSKILSVGISYQMHGLVIVDKNMQVLRPSIIWCDSRATHLGKKAFDELGADYCLGHLLNAPGNFTASKLGWVKENEPELFEQIHKWMLPGDYIAMKLTGEICSTISGYSEGIFWDFKDSKPAWLLMDSYGIPKHIMPDIVPNFTIQGFISKEASSACGLAEGTPITYRAGDQPNHAMSLKVLNPGDVAATAGTSGVVYGVTDQVHYDPKSRVNGFAHVNHSQHQVRIGQLLCINGCGIQYAWLRKNMGNTGTSYEQMEHEMSQVPVGSEGLVVLPFGNGSERMLENRALGASIQNLQFNIHNRSHLYRATIEGIACAFVYGIEILKTVGIVPAQLKVGNDNLFLSKIFSDTISSLLHCPILMYETTGASGAAKASLVGIGHFSTVDEAIQDMQPIHIYTNENNSDHYHQAYQNWHSELQKLLNQ
jgi:xylulokinase